MFDGKDIDSTDQHTYTVYGPCAQCLDGITKFRLEI
jgi:hypothetical protein